MIKLLLSGKRLSNAQISFFLQYLKNSNIFNQNRNSNGTINGSSSDQEKYNTLFADYQILQRKYSDLADSNTRMNDDDDSDDNDTSMMQTQIHKDCETKQKQLEDQIENYKKELEILKEQHQKKIQELRKQNDKLNTDIERSNSSKEDQKLDYEKNIRSLKETINKLEDDAQSLERSYKMKINDLENQLMDLRNNNNHSLSDIKSQLNSKEIQLATLESQLKDLDQQKNVTTAKLTSLTKQLDDKIKEFDQYKSSIENKISKDQLLNDQEADDNNQKIIKKYETEIKSLNQNKENIEKELDDCKQELAKTQKNFTAFTGKHTLEVEYLNKSIEKLETAQKTEKQKVNDLTDEVVQKDKEISQNVFMIKKLKEKVKSLEVVDENNNVSIPQKELDDTFDEISRLKQNIKDLEESQNKKIEQLNETNSKLSILERRLMDNNKELNDVTQLLEKTKEESEKLQIKLNETNRQLENNNERMKSSTDPDAIDLAKLRNELKNQQEKLKNAEAANKKLQDQIINHTTDSVNKINKDIEEKDMFIQELTSTLDTYKQRLQSAEERSHTYKNVLESLRDPHNEEIANKNNEIKKLKLNLQSQSEDVQSLEHQLIALKERNKLLQEKTLANTADVEMLNELHQQIENLKMELSKFQRQSAELKNMNKEQMEQIEDLLKQRKLVNENYNILKNLNEEYKTELKTNKNEYLARENELRETILELENKNMSLNEALNREHITNESRSRDTDLRDYYRLKYHREVRHNNDLRMINYYMNRVSQRTSRQMKMDYRKYNRILSDSRKFEESLNDYDYVEPNRNDPGLRYNTYANSSMNSRYDIRAGPSRYADNSSPLYFSPSRLKFKTVARFVQACVRMKQVALKNHWDDQRIRHLERRIDSTMDNSNNWSI